MAMHTGPHLLPAAVTLPDASLIGSAHLRDALGGVSKAVIHLWRKRYAFPRGHREGREFWTVTDAVRDWLLARGVKVAIK